jgi:signal transduction histidine kinase
MNAAAALRFLAKTPPDLDEVRAALTRVAGESRRASEVFDGIRDLFRKVGQSREPVDINELVGDALQSLLAELTDNGVLVRTQLEPGLPLVDGHKAQLQEVITNIVHNAIEAMRSTTDREVLIETKRHEQTAVAVDVEDTGPGVEPKLLHTIFDAFVTTKTEGMGLGLAICRRIVEAHDGQLFAVSDGKRGDSQCFKRHVGWRRIQRCGTESDCEGERAAFAIRANASSTAISARSFHPG